MAKVIKIRPRDLYVTIEFSLTNIKYLKAVLAKTQIAPETEMEEAGADYLEQIFEPLLSEIIEECKDGS